MARIKAETGAIATRAYLPLRWEALPMSNRYSTAYTSLPDPWQSAKATVKPSAGDRSEVLISPPPAAKPLIPAHTSLSPIEVLLLDELRLSESAKLSSQLQDAIALLLWAS
ncbi:hypothetical protein [Sphaerothrix gracilis]|uniref:hypothetical protein n=1 Tax=Sphaerothrix gracilis TaxID=3151835 RepID=UPI0031FC08D2